MTDELRAALFAEAYIALEADEPYWLADHELVAFAAERAADAVEQAPYTELIQARLSTAQTYQLGEIMSALGIGSDPVQWKSVFPEVRRSLKQAGWRTKTVRLFGFQNPQRRWAYKPKGVTGVTHA